jgi:AmiR/NasT family two-component response regulator
VFEKLQRRVGLLTEDAAAEAGVSSPVGFRWFRHAGGVNPCLAVGAMLATHAATALIADDVRLQFQSALASRDIIGQAKGMIMERFDVDAVRAFELLTKLSQNSNIRLAEVAEEIVSRGREPKTT